MSDQLSPILLRNLITISLWMIGILVLHFGFPALAMLSVWFSGIVFCSALYRLT